MRNVKISPYTSLIWLATFTVTDNLIVPDKEHFVSFIVSFRFQLFNTHFVCFSLFYGSFWANVDRFVPIGA